jgi:hypothetical protein
MGLGCGEGTTLDEGVTNTADIAGRGVSVAVGNSGSGVSAATVVGSGTCASTSLGCLAGIARVERFVEAVVGDGSSGVAVMITTIGEVAGRLMRSTMI